MKRPFNLFEAKIDEKTINNWVYHYTKPKTLIEDNGMCKILISLAHGKQNKTPDQTPGQEDQPHARDLRCKTRHRSR